MKTDFEFIGANPHIKCAELAIYGIKKPNEPFKEGEIITINTDNPKIKSDDEYGRLVSMIGNNGNFKLKKSVGRPPKNNNEEES